LVRFTNAKHSNTPPKINKKGAQLTFVGIKRRNSKFKSQLGRRIVNFQRHRFFPGVADEYWEPVNLTLSAREGSWVFKMADRMEQNETGTTEEFLPGIGELKTFSQVRRQGFLRTLYLVLLFLSLSGLRCVQLLLENRYTFLCFVRLVFFLEKL